MSEIFSIEQVQRINNTALEHPLARYRHRAMASVFDVLLDAPSPAAMQEMAALVFHEIDQVERALSYFIPTSDISRINALCAGEAVKVSPLTLDCLSRARTVWQETGGAFEPTVGALLTGRKPWDAEGDEPAGGVAPDEPDGPGVVGMDLISIDEDSLIVGLLADGVRLDLGGIGKGFALDIGAEVLRSMDVSPFFLNGGESVMLAVGAAPGLEGWPMTVSDPRLENEPLASFIARDCAVAASSTADRPHVLNPETGDPARRLGAWAVAPRAAEADALSTAFLLMSDEAIAAYCAAHPGVRAILLDQQNGDPWLRTFGAWEGLHWKKS